MGNQREVVGIVVRNKMDKGVIVAVERRVRHDNLSQDTPPDADIHGARRGEQRAGRGPCGHE